MDSFSDIVFPFFGFAVPAQVIHTKHKTYIIRKKARKKILLDDRRLGADFTTRSFKLAVEEKSRIKFKHCLDLDDLVFNHVRYGIDNSGTIRDFRGFRTKIYRKRVKKIVDDKVYIEGFTLPLKLPKTTKFRIRDAHVQVVLVENRWRIRKFFTYNLRGEEI